MEPRISFTWPSKVLDASGTNLVDDLDRLVVSARYEIVIMAYNVNTNSEFGLHQSLEECLKKTNPKIKLFCDSISIASSFASLFYHWKERLEIWYWVDDAEFSKFHIKGIAVDKEELYIGSANFSVTAMKSSAECGLFFNSPSCYNSIMVYLQKLCGAGMLMKYNAL